MTENFRIYVVLAPEDCPNRRQIKPYGKFICTKSKCKYECAYPHDFPKWCTLIEMEDDTDA